MLHASADRLTSAQSDLAAHLRVATADAHRSLEARLDLLRRPLDRRRFQGVLERFHGFHVTWEAAIRQRPRIAEFHAERGRLPHLRRDLSALGLTGAEVAALPVSEAAAELAADEATAAGAIYVLEGSTLGGQLISRELAEAAWLPPGGLTYFDPYGARTGEMWRGFKSWLAVEAPDPARTVDGARRTFQMLEGWLTR
ncbi:biliverdin-producing heme oxygenase [Phenylobacterium sp.]|jgi:heme oxygenase|uniref:biliverdin-producing heme oxygenase n=1 Tax=Phenylobacterium sp. TaxID=1871053 RepID=UPI0037842232